MGKCKMIPILWNHDCQKIIGKSEIKSNRLSMAFIDGFKITQTDLHGMLNCGFIVIESYFIDDIEYLKEVEILEFSIGAIKIK